MGGVPAGLDGNPDPIVSPARTTVIETSLALVTTRFEQRGNSRPLLVAVDGVDGAGKSTFADELAGALSGDGRSIIRSTIDWFHRPRADRRCRGDRSPIGFYEDSHDLATLRARLLDPLLAGVGHRYQVAAFDEPADRTLDPEPIEIAGDEILLFDGIFLLRPELAAAWDVTIFLDGKARVQLERLGLVFDDLAFAPAPNDTAVVDRVLDWVARIDRYASGMQIYLDSVDPASTADLVIDNNDLAHPSIVSGR